MRLTTFLACVAAALVAAGAADAQALFARPSAIDVAWPAPAGHFQPRAGDIPSGVPFLPSSEDRELDAKLKICRGC